MRSALLVAMLALTQSLMAGPLDRIAGDLARSSRIVHIAPAQVEHSAGLRFIDVRNADEFAVGHIAGAVRVDPAMDAATFVQEHAGLLKSDRLIFYCSTGRRSTRLAEDVAAILDQKDPDAPMVANLRGGIFAWHNERRSLVNAFGETRFIHPYNWWWSRLIDRDGLTRYYPECDECGRGE